MANVIRGAHFSDIHYAAGTLAEVDRCFTFAVDEAINRGVEFAVISGDSTDHALDIHAQAWLPNVFSVSNRSWCHLPGMEFVKRH